jgi:ribonuclease HI
MTKERPNSLKWLAFTDGASSGNPGPGGWGSIISSPEGRIWEIGGAHPHTTNNRMELMGTIQALRAMPEGAEAEVFTDSTYVIKGITQWIWGWIRRGWKTAEGKDVMNRDLWEDLSREVQRVGKTGVKFSYVPGHAGVPGNERVDQIAVAFSKGYLITLFKGDAKIYDVDLSQVAASEMNAEIKASSKKKSSSGPAVYFSLIGSKPEKHASWADCERRVKGQSGARFKKATSAEEETAILTSWGIDPDYFRRPGQ